MVNEDECNCPGPPALAEVGGDYADGILKMSHGYVIQDETCDTLRDFIGRVKGHRVLPPIMQNFPRGRDPSNPNPGS